MRRWSLLLCFVLGCGGGDEPVATDGPADVPIDAEAAVDAPAEIDAAVDAALEVDADIDGAQAVPLPGFGAISGMCGVLTTAELEESELRPHPAAAGTASLPSPEGSVPST